ncbi:S8 family peptidase [Allomuricauda taeanensis]|uniref:S8 family peptidase n=1 Tax=Flagellimonas taeanensis TaxID=1005926 RepID=UPI002E7AF2D2|nr:S8 family peptidase [Allomuricauda taeanensis]MEE1964128.1 S8 family peptidase [Allomuricauda taeanensis]
MGNRKISDVLLSSTQQMTLDKKIKIRVFSNKIELFKEWCIVRRIFPSVLYESNSFGIYDLCVSKRDIENLTKKPFVKFIDRTNRPINIEAPLANHDLSINKISALHSVFPNENGEGIVLSIKEGGYDPLDIDYRERSLFSDEMLEFEYSRHATEMATIALGAGNTSPNFRGVSKEAFLITSEANELTPDSAEYMVENEISIQNHSYGIGIESYYGIESFLYDQQVYENKNIVHVFSAGNLGDNIPQIGKYAGVGTYSNITGQFKVSKNTISVGATDRQGNVLNFSSSGPSEDGRIKPEIVAYGANGTSESAALVSGLVATMQGAYFKMYGKLPNASLVRAILINTADSYRFELTHRRGFGSVDGLGSLETIKKEMFMEETLKKGESHVFHIDVPDGTRKLNVTLAWTDLPAEPGSNRILQNDLDLTIESNSSGQIFRPWTTSITQNTDSLSLAPRRHTDSINNIEKVTVFNPIIGSYKITVQNSESSVEETQSFSIAYEFEKQKEWIYPVSGAVLDAKTSHYIRWNLPEDINGSYTLQLKNNETGQWTNIESNVDIQKGFFTWIAPDSFFEGRFRIIGDGLNFESPEFTVSENNYLNVEYVCEEFSLISWKRFLGADEYKIYELIDGSMKSLGKVSDTLFKFPTSNSSNKVLAIAPIINGKELKRSPSVVLDPNSGCYINDFYLTAPFGIHAELNLILNSKIGLNNIIFEKKVGNQYLEISRISDFHGKEYQIIDSIAPLQNVEYRARLIDQNGNEYITQLLDFRLIEENRTILAPNPVVKGNELSIYSSYKGNMQFEVYDISGRFLLHGEGDGLIRKMDISSLNSGFYILVIKANDKKSIVKFIVK